MQIILLLIIVSLIIAGGFLVVFLWAVRSGQYDDSETPALKVLIEDDMLTHQKPSN